MEVMIALLGCCCELLVLCYDGHQALEAEAGEAQQELVCLSLGHLGKTFLYSYIDSGKRNWIKRIKIITVNENY